MSRSLVQIFRAPAVIALASAAGLVSALLADGWADALSWLALGGAASVGLWHALRPQPRSQRRNVKASSPNDPI